jgi:hypothetical protein
MRAKEFITDNRHKQVDEFAPVVAALGGAIARGASALATGAANVGSKVIQGATAAGKAIGKDIVGGIENVAKQTVGSVGTSGSTATPQAGGASTPINMPPNTKIEPTPSSDPNQLKFNIGGANFTLDTTDPKNNQTIQQLKQQLGKQQ